MESNASYRQWIRKQMLKDCKEFMTEKTERLIHNMAIDIVEQDIWETDLPLKKSGPLDIEKNLSDEQLIQQAMCYLTHNQKVCCFTGLRSSKLPPEEKEMTMIYSRLAVAIKNAIVKDYRVFINGGCNGVDIIASEILLDMRTSLSEYGITLVTVVPFKSQAEDWTEEWKARYRALLDNSDVVITLSDNYFSGCYKQRNTFMVVHSDLCIAVSDGRPGGTMQTINMAKRSGVPVYCIPCAADTKPTFFNKKG